MALTQHAVGTRQSKRPLKVGLIVPQSTGSWAVPYLDGLILSESPSTPKRLASTRSGSLTISSFDLEKGTP
jgi:hypothetical protein